MEALLSGIRVVESSVLLPAFLGTFFSDLGAEVIKVEPPGGDYIRQMTWPIVQGTSLVHLHTNRGKKSLVLDLKQDAGKKVYRDLVRESDVVIEGMRPGSLQRIGLGYEVLREVNPKIVFATLSGYGATGPYQKLPSHGIAFDAWSGIVAPVEDELGFKRIPPEMPNVGINVGPMVTAMAILAGVIKARETGEGCELDVAQSDASAYLDWQRIEAVRSGLPPHGDQALWAFAAKDGDLLLFGASEAAWAEFCAAVERPEWATRWPSGPAEARPDEGQALQEALTELFKGRTRSAWLDWVSGRKAAGPADAGEAEPGTELVLAPINETGSLATDPQFASQGGFLTIEDLGCEQLAFPLRVGGRALASPGRAPDAGEHSAEVLAEVLGLDAEGIHKLQKAGVSSE